MLRVEGLWKSYTVDGGKVPAVRGVDLTVETGEFFTLLGPSGCGKSTTLRCIAGLEVPDSGEITSGETALFSSRQRGSVPIHKRNIGMVFQSYAIWPHMSVYDNVDFPVKIKGVANRREKVMRALDLVGLDQLEDRAATDLSGGQQQRVAVARAIVMDVDLLLFDEPLSNLDSKLRLQMRFELRQLQKQLGITSIYVTHDQEEAMVLSDRVAVMDDGIIVEIGKPQDIYLAPRKLFTAKFVGQSNLLAGEVVSADGATATVRTAIGEIAAGALDRTAPSDGFLMIRPEHIPMSWVREDLPSSDVNVFEGTIVSETFTGKLVDYQVRVGDMSFEVQTTLHGAARRGSRVFIHLPPERCVMLPKDTPGIS